MTGVFDTDDPRNIWVSPNAGGSGDGMGTHDDPFPSLPAALKKAAPGQYIILMPGTYPGDRTIEISGDEKSPVYITAQKPGEAIIEDGCWYFYDTSDLVVSGLTFRNARSGAVSVVGQCLRNRFHSIKFIDCGRDPKSSCTFYFGGAGGRFNLVENCVFLRSDNVNKSANGHHADISAIENTVVGLMVSDGSDDFPLMNHAVARNHFSGYDRAVILGSGDAPDNESWHTLERNTIVNCRIEGITIRCSDVAAMRNFISGCACNGIDIAGKRSIMAAANRISDCNGGIAINGTGHSITQNHIVRCKSFAICAMGADGGLPAAQNLIITNNKISQCGTAEGIGAVIIGSGTSGVFIENHFYGTSQPWAFQSPDNIFAFNKNVEGISADEYVDDGDDSPDAGGEDNDTDEDGYMDASMPDDDDDIDTEDDGDDAGSGNEIDDMINYMFNRD